MQSKEKSPARSPHTLEYPDIISDFVSYSLRRGLYSDTSQVFDDLRELLKTLSEWDGGIDSCPSADFFNDLGSTIVWVERANRKRREPTLCEAVKLLDRRRSRLGVCTKIESAYKRARGARRCLPLIDWIIATGRWQSPESQELLTALRGGYITEQHWQELMGPFRKLPGSPQRNHKVNEWRGIEVKPACLSRADALAKMMDRESNLRLWPFFAFLLESCFYGEGFIDLDKEKDRERLLARERKRKQRRKAKKPR